MAQKAKGGNTVAAVEALVEPVLAQLGLRLWDVRYEKEGPDRFLRIFIDRDEPLDIDACEEATRAINPVIDEADPIPESYYMEVGGPGLGRHLTKDAHFEAMRGREVLAHLIRPGRDGRARRARRSRGEEGRRDRARLRRRCARHRRKGRELLQIVRRRRSVRLNAAGVKKSHGFEYHIQKVKNG